MNFLDKNGFRAALVIAVIFLAMPFMFPERVPANNKGNAEDSSQPVKSKKFVTGIYDRIGNFYSFKKTKKSGLDQTLEQLKKEADAASSADKKTEAAETKNSFEKSSADAGSASSGGSSESDSFDTGSSSSKLSYSAAAAKAGAKPKLSIGGKEYEVVKDLYGNDYAITGQGPVAVKSLLAKGGVLKYPSGKVVSSANVSSEAYNAGGGANPYASSYSSSKSSGGSYKGGKRSGGVASTRKISSGFSLSGGGGSGGGSRKKSGKGAGARPYSGEFTGAVDIEDAYSSIQSQALEARNNSYAASETYYEPAYAPAVPSAVPSAAPAPAPYAAVAPEILQKESMFESGTKASAKSEGTAVETVVKKMSLNLDMNDPAKTATDSKPVVAGGAKKVEVDININKGTGVIPNDKEVLKSMTTQLLGENVIFESLPANSKDSILNPWVFPTQIPNSEEASGIKEFSVAFWEENKDALSKAKTNTKGQSYSDPETWRASDKSNYAVSKYIKSKNMPVKVVVLDGMGTGSQKNYFQQMANYITGTTPVSKVAANTIYVYKNDADLEGIKSGNLVKHTMSITPEENKNFGIKIQTQFDAIEKASNSAGIQKDVLKETRRMEDVRIKKDIKKAGEDIAKLKL